MTTLIRDRVKKTLAIGWVSAAGLAGPAGGQTLADFEEAVTEHVLANGMKFIIVERPAVPVVAFHLYADVGSVQEELGASGMAHMFEHMAFKGTSEIGTTNAEAEKRALERVEEAYQALQEERAKGKRADPARMEQLRAAFEKAQDEAARYVVTNEYGRIVEENGGVGMNATTSSDATRYFFSLPSNKVELWFALESSRFIDPVLREFYKERDVVLEERRLRVESEPIGTLLEDFLSVAYKAHPYGRAVIGWRSDLENLTRSEAREFYRQHYTPLKLTACIVGDVDPRQIIELAELYFGRIPHGPEPERLWTREPSQNGERRTTVYAQSQPLVLIGYHKPSVRHADDAVFDAVQDIIAGGRTSRIYRSLVRDQKIAVAAGGFPGYPGNKYPNMFLFYAFAAPDRTNRGNEAALLAEIEKLKEELVSVEELERVKQRAKATLVAQLGSNTGLAGQLAAYEVLTGDWRNRFRTLEEIEKVTREDIQRVARTYFTERNRTVGYLLSEPVAQPSAAKEPEGERP